MNYRVPILPPADREQVLEWLRCKRISALAVCDNPQTPEKRRAFFQELADQYGRDIVELGSSSTRQRTINGVPFERWTDFKKRVENGDVVIGIDPAKPNSEFNIFTEFRFRAKGGNDFYNGRGLIV